MIEQYRQNLLAVAEAIAPGWERRRGFVDETAAPVREWMIDALAPQRGDTILDVAAGAGDVGFAAVGRLGDSGRLITTDFSPAMLDVARRRAAQLGLGVVDFRVMDGEKLELEDDSVDGILCRFGYMLMADPATALAEARRVLRRGGRIALAVWGPPERNPFFTLIGMTLVRHGHIPPPEPGEPGVFALADVDRLNGLLERAGFGDVRVVHIPVIFAVEGIDEYLAIIADTAGPIGLTVRALTDDARTAIADELREPFREFTAPGGYHLPGVALVAYASRA